MSDKLSTSLNFLNRQISEAKGSEDAVVGALISKLLKSISFSHHQHLTTKIHSRHLALKEYYEGMPDVVDSFAECAIALGYSQEFGPESDQTTMESLIDELREDCRSVHAILDEKGQFELTNPLEDIMTCLTSVKYKLAQAS